MIFETVHRRSARSPTLVRALRAEECPRQAWTSSSIKAIVYQLFNNRVYLGEAVHKGTAYPGEHQAIIERALWDRVHAILRRARVQRARNTRVQTPALLKGLIFGPTGVAMTPSYTHRKGETAYRYYVSTDVLKRRPT